MSEPGRDSRPFVEADHLLRRTFTWRFVDREDVAALNRVAERLQELTFETGQHGPEDPTTENLLEASLKAAGEDVLLLGEYLLELARERFHSGMTEQEIRLCERAESWANQATALGELILSHFKERG